MSKIRYKYTESRKGTILKNVKCPVCKSNHINWIKVIEQKSWAGRVVLLAECWSGDTTKDLPRHLFIIEIEKGVLPEVEISKTK